LKAARALLLAIALLAVAPHAARAADDAQTERLVVDDPYAELRTGPGRSYPVFYVVARHEWIEIELRHTDWYKVRTEHGQEGWIDRRQLETTLTEAGSKKTFRDVLLEDYLSRHLEFGAGWGHFESEPVLKLWSTYYLTDTIGAELTFGQVQGQYSGTNFWHLDLTMQPWAEQRVSPFFGIGLGRIDNVPNASLVGAINTNSNSANAMLGVRVHLTDRLVARADWTAYTSLLSSSQTAQFHAITAGLSFFFY
jgi:uncharacterized protein YgiM (DUF1202 family)